MRNMDMFRDVVVVLGLHGGCGFVWCDGDVGWLFFWWRYCEFTCVRL